MNMIYDELKQHKNLNLKMFCDIYEDLSNDIERNKRNETNYLQDINIYALDTVKRIIYNKTITDVDKIVIMTSNKVYYPMNLRPYLTDNNSINLLLKHSLRHPFLTSDRLASLLIMIFKSVSREELAKYYNYSEKDERIQVLKILKTFMESNYFREYFYTNNNIFDFLSYLFDGYQNILDDFVNEILLSGKCGSITLNDAGILYLYNNYKDIVDERSMEFTQNNRSYYISDSIAGLMCNNSIPNALNLFYTLKWFKPYIHFMYRVISRRNYNDLYNYIKGSNNLKNKNLHLNLICIIKYCTTHTINASHFPDKKYKHLCNLLGKDLGKVLESISNEINENTLFI